MGITLTVTSTGTDVGARLRAMSFNAKHPEKVWPTVGSYLAAANRRQFATQGAYFGSPWKPLQPDYLQWKVKEGYSKRILMQTGDMRLSFTSRPMGIEKYMGSRAEFGSGHRLAKFHQFGTYRNGKRAIPARPIMRITPKVRADVKKILADHVKGRRTRIMRLV